MFRRRINIAISIMLVCATASLVQSPHVLAQTWTITMTVTLSGGGQDAAKFGARAGATSGLDANIDVPNPPAPPTGGVDAYFEITHPLFPRLAEDYRSAQDSSIAWKFVITGTGGQSGTLTWNASAFPVGNPARAVLQIKQGSTVLANMLTQSSLNFTGDQNLDIICFSTAKVAVETRRVEAVPESFFMNSFPNPFSTTTTFEIGLPIARPVVVQIFNLLGQEIRTFTLAPVAPGRSTILWDGKDARGVPAPNGVYFARLESRGVSVWRKLYRLR